MSPTGPESPPKRPRGRPRQTSGGPARPLASGEAARLMAGLSPRDRAIVALMLGGGLRVAEVCHLRVRDVAPEAASLIIERATAKTRRSRRVYLARAAQQELALYLATQEVVSPDQRVFETRLGAPLRPAWLQRHIATLMERTGLGDCTSHSLRRTHACKLESMQAPITVITAQLGHRSVQTTQLYMQQTPPHQREWVEALQI